MKYEELKQLLIEHMNNGSTINLKSLLNTLIQCDDVHDIRFCYRDYRIASKDFKEAKITYSTRYMVGYIKDKNGREIYNNIGIDLVNESRVVIGIIWFGREDLISLYERRDRNHDRIKHTEINLADNINLIRVDDDRVDCKILFEEGEILNE